VAHKLLVINYEDFRWYWHITSGQSKG